MQKQICKYLNHPFPLFLACRKGRIYFIWMILILEVLANILQPFGLTNIHDFHKGIVLTDYIFLFFSVYALLYMMLSYFRRDHYKPDSWTVGKELQALFLFLPAIACVSCLYACLSVPEFNLTLDTFVDIQLYNSVMCVVTIPGFGYFIATRLKATEVIPTTKRITHTADSLLTTATGNPDEEPARKLLEHLHEVMTTEQLYLSSKCNLHLVSDHTGIPVYRISSTINHFTGYTFTDFVNKYRVEHVCRILQQGKNKRLKLEAIGLECGFGSKVNFYIVFKKFMGKTPAEYLAGL